jgi:hypothetical protein
MLGILANYANNPIPLDNLAFVADGLHAGSDFHSNNLLNLELYQVP